MQIILRAASVCCGLRPAALVLLVGVLSSGCGDVSQASDDGAAACDAGYCIDCADACCFDLGYC